MSDDQEPVPRLPRKFFTRGMTRDLYKIAFLALALIAVIGLRRSCGEGVGKLMQSFEPPIDASTAVLPSQYRRLTPQEIEQHFGGSQPAGGARDAGPGR